MLGLTLHWTVPSHLKGVPILLCPSIYNPTRVFAPVLLEIPNFLTEEECQNIIDLASGEGLDTSEVQDPETGVNIEPTNEQTFHSWDYNHDGVIDKVEVQNIKPDRVP